MKKTTLLFLAIALLASCTLTAQVAINTDGTNPDSSAMLDIKSSDKGMLIPRLTTYERLDITNPAIGLMVYDTDANSFYFYDGSLWKNISTGADNPWSISGDNIVNTNSGNIGIGTSSPNETLHVSGNIKIEDGCQAEGKLLISDSLGKGQWKTPDVNTMLGTVYEPDYLCLDVVGSLVLGSLNSVDVSGNYAYVVDKLSDRLKVIDVSDPTNPFLAGTLYIEHALFGVVSGNYVYMSAGDYLEIADVSNPVNPTLVGNLYLGNLNRPTSIAVSGNYAYVVGAKDDDLQVIDVSNPSSPTLTGSLIGSDPQAMTISGNHIYMLDRDYLKIADISSPASPTMASSLEIGSSPLAVSVSGNYAYVVDDDSDDLKIIDISNPASPTLAGILVIGPDPTSVAVSGNYAYVIDKEYEDLKVINITNPISPTLVSNLIIGHEPTCIATCGNYAYVGDQDSDDLKVIELINCEGSLNINPDGSLFTSKKNWKNNGGDIYNYNPGNVGIGTTDPLSDLHIIQRGTNPALLFENRFSNDVDIAFNSDQDLNIGHFDTTNSLFTSRINVTSSGRVKIGSLYSTSSGYVGIGTVSPLARLHIRGSDDQKMIIESTNDNEAQLELKSDNSRALLFYREEDNDFGIYFEGRPDYNGTCFRLDGNGDILLDGRNVGVGTDSPVANLHVAQDGTNPAIYITDAASSEGELAVPVGEHFDIGHYNTSDSTFTSSIHIQSDDDVSMQGALQLIGDNGGGGSADAKINKNDNANRDELQIYATGDAYSTNSKGSGIHLYGNHDSQHGGNISFMTGNDGTGNARMIIAGGGGPLGRDLTDTRVTIGNTLWNYVDNQNDVGMLNLKDTEGRPALFITGASSTEGEIAIPSTENFDIGHYNTSDSSFTSRLHFHDNGAVGIGTTDPDARLHLTGTGDERLIVETTDDDEAQLELRSNSSRALLFYRESDNDFGINFSGRPDYNGTIFRLDGNGDILMTGRNVGIGISSPLANLHVAQSGSNPAIYISGAGSTEGEIAIEDGGAFDIGHFNSSTSTFTSRLQIEGSGEVGIGTTSPDCLLSVIGAKTNGHIAMFENSGFSDANNDGILVKLTMGEGWGAGNNFMTFKSVWSDDVVISGQIEMWNHDDFSPWPSGSTFAEIVCSVFASGLTTVTGLSDIVSLLINQNAISACQNMGVVYTSIGADYAEYIEKEDPNEKISGGMVVGVKNGKISKVTEGADKVFTISTRPIVIGNTVTDSLRYRYGLAAFLGQSYVWVRGTVNSGDYIVASGKDDGYAIAVASDDLKQEQLTLIVGRAWESNLYDFPKLVNTAVGIESGETAHILKKQQDRIAALENKINQMSGFEERLAKIEKELMEENPKEYTHVDFK